MSKGQAVEERRSEAEEALARLEELPVEPVCVWVATAVRLTGIPRPTLYELMGAG